MSRKYCCVASVQVSHQPQPGRFGGEENSKLPNDVEAGLSCTVVPDPLVLRPQQPAQVSAKINVILIPKRSIVSSISNTTPALCDLSQSMSATVLVTAKIFDDRRR